jgi:thioredoxin reductase (NADPH)
LSNAIVIGSGPAGLTAAIYLVRSGIETTVISGDKPGGQLIFTTEVENFPGFPEKIMGPDLMIKMREQTSRVGAKFVDESVIDVDFSKRPFIVRTDSQELRTDIVIIATGASPIWLGLESEEKLKGRGVSACATCDGYFFKGKDVVMVGGGDVAIEDSLFLAKIVNKVTVINRRDELRASHILQQRAFANAKISFVSWHGVRKILGENKVTGVQIENLKDGRISEISCDAVFVAIGHKPNSEIFRGKIRISEKGFIEKVKKSQTSVEGVFVAGDVFDYEYRQAVTAAGSGAQAAIDAIRFIETQKT